MILPVSAYLARAIWWGRGHRRGLAAAIPGSLKRGLADIASWEPVATKIYFDVW